MNNTKHLIISGALFAALFLLALLFFLISLHGDVRRVLFFPEIKTNKLVPEARYIQKQKSLADNVRALVEELRIGSALHGRTRLLPAGTKIISIFMVDQDLTINFSSQILQEDDKVHLPLEGIMQALVNNILFNFRKIQQCLFYIDGELLPATVIKNGGETRQIYKHEFDESMLE